ncbi:hypothetical protein OAO01_05685, partial [Oligoflexia bacterium]|nr:hypothetical protein [Oligoflexia bacterium]
MEERKFPLEQQLLTRCGGEIMGTSNSIFWIRGDRWRDHLSFLLFLLLVLTPLSAWSKPSRAGAAAVLYYDMNLDFAPEAAFFFVNVGNVGKTSKLKAVLIPPYQMGSENLEGTGHWLAGVRVPVPRNTRKLEYSIIFIGRNGEYDFVPNVIWDLTRKKMLPGVPEELRALLNERKEVLQSWQIQLESQAGSLQRLKADADVIGNLGKAYQVDDQVAAINIEIKNVEKDISRLKKFVLLASRSTTPKNFARRELQLTQQLKELAMTSRSIEQGEALRGSQAEANLQQKLRLVEATRFSNPDQLRSELIRLRRRRLELEQKLGI